MGAVIRHMWSPRVVAKYWALQLPELAVLVVVLLWVQEPLGISEWLFWSILGLWLVKDVAVYPMVWRSYDPAAPGALHALDDEQGVATERLDPSGRVRVRGELWWATLAYGARPVEEGEIVRVQARRGLTLIVARPSDTPRR